MAKPKFDPNQPFEVVGAKGAKPKFDPSQPFVPGRVFTGKEERAEEDKKLVESMGPTHRFLVGAGAGLSNIAKNVADIAAPILPDALVPDRQKWAEERELVAPVTDTTAGMVGEMVGEAAPLIPLGLGAEGLAEGVAARVLPKVATRVLPKALGTLAKHFVGGAVPGYVGAGPEHREAGAYGGALVNMALPYVGRGLSKAWRGIIKPSAAAKALQEAGVEHMTIGQMAPENILAGFEEAGQSGPLGASIKAAREKALESYRKVVVNRGLAPGAAEVASAADPNAAVAQAYKGFKPAYDAIRREPVNVSGIGKALARAGDDPGVIATPDEVKAAQRYLANQAGLLERAAPEVTNVVKPPKLRAVPSEPVPVVPAEPKTMRAEKWQLPNAKNSGAKPLGALPKALKREGGLTPTHRPSPTQVVSPPVLGPLPKLRTPQPPPSIPTTAQRPRSVSGAAALAEEAAPAAAPVAPRLSGQLTADPLLQARSNIRDQIFKARKEGKYALADLLESGEDVLSNRLIDELPESAVKSLKATDAQYRLHQIVSDAVGRGGDAGFRPSHLSAAVKKATQKGAYERGAGGSLRGLASLGRKVFDTRIPATGARAMMRLPIPLGIGQSIGDALMIGTTIANQPTIRRALVGQHGIQRGATAAENWLAKHGLLDALRLNMSRPDAGKMDPNVYAARARAEALRRRWEGNQ